jgi:hypothetical protein
VRCIRLLLDYYTSKVLGKSSVYETGDDTVVYTGSDVLLKHQMLLFAWDEATSIGLPLAKAKYPIYTTYIVTGCRYSIELCGQKHEMEMELFIAFLVWTASQISLSLNAFLVEMSVHTESHYTSFTYTPNPSRWTHMCL